MMNRRNDLHLDEEQLFRAVVDESDLSAKARDHLSSCLSCREERERIEESLARLGEMAERFAPLPVRKMVAPLKKAHDFRIWAGLPEWRWTLKAGVAVAVAVVIALGSVVFTVRQERNIARLDREMLDDERLITEVGKLEENALPTFYFDISEGAAQDHDEDLIESGVRAPQRSA